MSDSSFGLLLVWSEEESQGETVANPGAWHPRMATNLRALTDLKIVHPDAELGHPDLQSGADVTRLLASPVVELGLTRKRAHPDGSRCHGVVGPTATCPTVTLTKCWEHRDLSTK